MSDFDRDPEAAAAALIAGLPDEPDAAAYRALADAYADLAGLYAAAASDLDLRRMLEVERAVTALDWWETRAGGPAHGGMISLVREELDGSLTIGGPEGSTL